MTTSTTTRRVVEPAESPRWLHLPEQWLRALVAGAEAAVLSWLVVVVPAIATYVATASSPELGSAHWVDAARVGTVAWLLAHGAAPSLAQGTISVLPLGLTLVTFALLVGSVRRARLGSWAAGSFAVLAYVAFTTAFLAFASTPGTTAAILGAALLALVAVPCGLRGTPAPAWWQAIGTRIPQFARDAAGLGWRILAVHLALAAVATIAMILTHLEEIGTLRGDLAPDAVSTVVLAAAELLVLPTVIVWAGAYLLGPGFAVGTGTVFSPAEIVAGPLPVVPVLGALPQPDSVWGQLPVLGLCGLVSGVVAGLWMLRRLRQRSALPAAGAVAGGVVLGAAGFALLAALTAGAVGPGVMSDVGASWQATGTAMLWQCGAGAAVVIVLGHPVTGQLGSRMKSGAGVWWQQVRG